MALSLKRPARFAPREPRAAVAIESSLLLPDDREAQVCIRNISTEGFMGETLVELQPETWFGIVLPRLGIVRAKVRWYDSGAFGAQFGKALDVEQLEDWPAEEAAGTGFLQARIRKKPSYSLRS